MTRASSRRLRLDPQRRGSRDDGQLPRGGAEVLRRSPVRPRDDKPPHTKWATGSNSSTCLTRDPERKLVIALGAIDNLGKGAADKRFRTPI